MLEAHYKLILKILSAQVVWTPMLQNMAWGGKACSCVGSILSVLICHMYLEEELISTQAAGNGHVA